MMRILVTGGLGFLGSHFIRRVIAETDWEVHNLDCGSSAAIEGSRFCQPTRLKLLPNTPHFPRKGQRHVWHRVDLTDRDKLHTLVGLCRPQMIVHFAAETGVDRSLVNATDFVRSNVEGTLSLLDATQQMLGRYSPSQFRFLYVSSDSVYGPVPRTSRIGGRWDDPSSTGFREDNRTAPTNPSSVTQRRSSCTASCTYWQGSKATPMSRGLTFVNRS